MFEWIYLFDKSIIALDCGADHPVVCSCIKIFLSDSPSIRAPFVQSIAASLSPISLELNKSGSILTSFLLIGLLLETFLPLAGPLGSGIAGPAGGLPDGGDAPGRPRVGPLAPGGLRVGPLAPGGPCVGPLEPGGPCVEPPLSTP